MLSEINEINKTLSSVPENKDSPQQTFHDIWHLIFGGFHNFVEKKRISRVVDLENFKMSLEHKIADIPKGSLVEPKLSTLGPALEASKYYIGEEQLREMFAKLIASSMDNRVDSKVHPAFVEIIKQLQPIEAEILTLFKNKSLYQIINLGIEEGNSSEVIFPNVFIDLKKEYEYDIVSSSIDNIVRLGLAATDYLKYLANCNYERFKKTPEYNKLLKKIRMSYSPETTLPSISKGIIYTTQLGKKFIDVCL